MKIEKQKIIIIIVGLAGCFMTSLAGVIAVMIFNNWSLQGGFSELLLRMSVGYPAASCIVVLVFPFLIPKLTNFLERKLN